MRKIILSTLTGLLFLSQYCLLQAQVYIRDSSDTPNPGALLMKKDSVLNFIVMGDWGRNGAGHQKQVAEQMGKTAGDVRAQFIISNGDNFYPDGVISGFDPLFRYSFEDIYTAFSLQWDW